MDLINQNDVVIRAFNYMSGFIVVSQDVLSDDQLNAVVPSDLRSAVQTLTEALTKSCEELDMPLVVNQANRVKELLSQESANRADLFAQLGQLNSRIMEYMASQTLLVFPSYRSEHYHEPLKDWHVVPSSFPSAVDAIEESEKCFALGRTTASVFHLMAIVQIGLTALAKNLRVNVDLFDTWEKVIGGIEGAISAKRASMARQNWKRIEAFYDEALSDLRSIKNAWRNPTMHFRRSYDEAQAAKVRERVKDFMIHLSTRLKERSA
jgi:hypothetical protein